MTKKYRFKTRAEFQSDYGDNWKHSLNGNSWVETMDSWFGKTLTDHDNVQVQTQCGCKDSGATWKPTQEAYGSHGWEGITFRMLKEIGLDHVSVRQEAPIAEKRFRMMSRQEVMDKFPEVWNEDFSNGNCSSRKMELLGKELTGTQLDRAHKYWGSTNADHDLNVHSEFWLPKKIFEEIKKNTTLHLKDTKKLSILSKVVIEDY